TPRNRADFAMRVPRPKRARECVSMIQVKCPRTRSPPPKSAPSQLGLSLFLVGVGAAAGGLAAPPWFGPAMAAALNVFGATMRQERAIAESRSLARLINSRIFLDTQAIKPPRQQALKSLQSAPLNALLTAYDLNVNGTLQIRRARLGIFLGLVSRFA
ncbi:hypothetical protein BCR33DRAFT_718919, partial [Rhizoclosmatium globosum]